MILEMRDVLAPACQKIVDPQNLASLREQPVAQMASDKPCGSSQQYAHDYLPASA